MKYIYIILVISFLIAILVVSCYGFQFRVISAKPEVWAWFGDYIGGILGALFGFCSIIVVCITFYKQDESQRVQQLDASFFNLLSVQQRIVESIKGGIELKGGATAPPLSGFNYINQLVIVIQNNEKELTDDKNYKEKLFELYKYRVDQNLLGHYYRHLYHILKYIDSSNVPEFIKRKYINILQAQMSDHELYLCVLNCCGECGVDKFVDLLDKYSFLENIRNHGENFGLLIKSLFRKTNFKYYNSRESGIFMKNLSG